MSFLPPPRSAPAYPRLSRYRGKSKGFALLITITLLAFLVLLLVSLASLTRVETQVASNSQQLAQARQNALMALNIAIGQLQKTVGPDQRTTFRADMMDPNNVNGAPFNALPKPGLSKWIAAVGNGNSASYAATPSAIPVYATTGSVNKPILLNWLVSGNETAAFTPQADGHISSPSSSAAASAAMTYNPVQAVAFTAGGATSLTDSNLSALSTNVTVNNQPAQLLVGPNSVSTGNAAYAVADTSGTISAASASSTPATGGSDYVFAPKVPIIVPAGVVPGLNTAATIGKYAYWIGDENTKARANLVDNYLQQTTAATQQANTLYSAFVAQHTGIGFMDSKGGGYANSLIGLDGKPSASVTDTKDYIIGTDFNYNNYDTNNITLNSGYQDTNMSGGPTGHIFNTDAPRLLTKAQIPFIGQVDAQHPTYTSKTDANLQTALKNRFNDISLTSASVLADSYSGGLKKDLSAALVPGWTPPAKHDTEDKNPLFTPQINSDYDPNNLSQWSAMPNWGQLRSYFQLRDSVSPIGTIDIAKPTATSMGIYPSVVYAAVGFSVYADNSGQLYLAMYPVIGLNNPYLSQLHVPAGQGHDQIGFSFRNQPGELMLTLSVDGTQVGQPIDLVQDIQGGPGKYLTFTLDSSTSKVNGSGNAGLFDRGVITKFYLTQNSAIYQPSGNNPLSYSSKSNSQSHCVFFKLANMSLSAQQITDLSTVPPALAPAGSYQLKYTGTVQGEMDVVYASSTSTGPPSPALTQAPPPNGASASNPDVWWNAIQHCVFAPISGPGAMLASSPTTPFPQSSAPPAPNVDFIVSSILSPKNNYGYDSSIYLHNFSQANVFRSRISSRTGMDTWGNGSTINVGNNTFTAEVIKDSDPSIPTNGKTTLAKMETAGNNVSMANYYFVGFGGAGQAIIFDLPRDDIPLLSLGQVQNVNLSLLSNYPAWAFGNSLADVRIPGTSTYVLNAVEVPGSISGKSNTSMVAGTSSFQDTYYDLSWYLNRALWDKYFVSGVPTKSPATSPITTTAWTQADIDADKPLPNARLIYFKPNALSPQLNDISNVSGSGNSYDRAAANLMIAGGFNINSTSEQAWRAELSGTYNVPYRPLSTDRTTPVQDIQVHRTVSLGAWWDTRQEYYQSSAGSDWNYKRAPAGGDRYLSYYSSTNWQPTANPPQVQILPYVVARLAQAIVQQVKIRGPFLSMADFVNRRLVDTSPSTLSATSIGRTGLNGALQNALNTDTSVSVSIPAYSPRFPSTATGYLSPTPIVEYGTDTYVPSAKPTGSSWNVNHMRNGDASLVGKPQAQQQSYNSQWMAGSPQMITQADLLSTFGPAMLSRSDTFTIRTYGEVLDPVNSTSTKPVILARAWCEAVVQRIPTFVDAKTTSNPTGNNAYDNPNDTITPVTLTSTNQYFGRRFKLISFKWLTPNDI